jgi:hypothetical protein
VLCAAASAISLHVQAAIGAKNALAVDLTKAVLYTAAAAIFLHVH